MIIITGLPCSGTCTLVSGLKQGGLSVSSWDEIKPAKIRKNLKEKICDEVNKVINKNNRECIEVPIIVIKKIEGQHKFILVERNLNDTFTSMEKVFKKEPHKVLIELNLREAKRYLKKEKKDVIYLDYNELMHNPEIELEKIKNIIPDFDKAVIEVKLKSKK